MNPKQVLELYSKPTKYEQENGIKVLEKWQFFYDAQDIKVFTRRKSDGSTTMLLVFRAGLSNNWCGWMVNQKQEYALCNTIPQIIAGIERMNYDIYMA